MIKCPFCSKKYFKYCFLAFIIIIFTYRVIFIRNSMLMRSTKELLENEIPKLVNQAKAENQRRRSHVEKICRLHHLGQFKSHLQQSTYKEPPAPQYEVFYYDMKHRLSWCPIYKAGSSTWLFNLALLGGLTKKQIAESKLQLSQLVRNIFPQLTSSDAIAILPRTLKFLIVRHPFERILSAYRDKLENIAVRNENGSEYFYKKYGRKIVSKYRPGGNGTNVRSLLTSSQYIWNNDKEPVGIEPTFNEFVRYLIETDLMTRADDHWIPFYLFCTPCSLNYDIIGKVETMFQDQLLIIHTAHLQNEIWPQWRHKTNPFNQTNHNLASEVAKIYFSQLNEHEIEKLYQKYKLDFELFQYDEKDYYKYAKKSSS